MQLQTYKIGFKLYNLPTKDQSSKDIYFLTDGRIYMWTHKIDSTFCKWWCKFMRMTGNIQYYSGGPKYDSIFYRAYMTNQRPLGPEAMGYWPNQVDEIK